MSRLLRGALEDVSTSMVRLDIDEGPASLTTGTKMDLRAATGFRPSFQMAQGEQHSKAPGLTLQGSIARTTCYSRSTVLSFQALREFQSDHPVGPENYLAQKTLAILPGLLGHVERTRWQRPQCRLRTLRIDYAVMGGLLAGRNRSLRFGFADQRLKML